MTAITVLAVRLLRGACRATPSGPAACSGTSWCCSGPSSTSWCTDEPPPRPAGRRCAHLAEPAGWACSVCSDPNDPRSAAYYDMTIFMTLLPLIAMGIIGSWLYRRVVMAEAASLR
ncbi:MAG: hypothetical protein R3F59_00470 [Myxococcota bacterium]